MDSGLPPLLNPKRYDEPSKFLAQIGRGAAEHLVLLLEQPKPLAQLTVLDVLGLVHADP